MRVPEIDAALAAQVAKIVSSIRNLDLKKAPSISETIDWARTLLYLGKGQIDPQVIGETLHVLLKYQSDIVKARKELIAAMEKAEIDSPRGKFTLSKAHNPVQDIYLRKVQGLENRVAGVAVKALAAA